MAPHRALLPRLCMLWIRVPIWCHFSHTRTHTLGLRGGNEKGTPYYCSYWPPGNIFASFTKILSSAGLVVLVAGRDAFAERHNHYSSEREVRTASQVVILWGPHASESTGKRASLCWLQWLILIQFRSVAQSCLTLCDPMNPSRPGLPVHHQLPEFTQTHVRRVSEAIQPSHPLSSPSPPAPNPSRHQSLFQWVNSSHEVAKVLEFQL